jgi:hypothetical protein
MCLLLRDRRRMTALHVQQEGMELKGQQVQTAVVPVQPAAFRSHQPQLGRPRTTVWPAQIHLSPLLARSPLTNVRARQRASTAICSP